MPNRFCAACCEYYDISLFYKQPENTDGYAYFCKTCLREQKRGHRNYGIRKTSRFHHSSCYSQTPKAPAPEVQTPTPPPDFTIVLE